MWRQGWIQGHLLTTLHVVRVTPTSGTFALGPDDVLRFHGGEGVALADLPFNTFEVQFDRKQLACDTPEVLLSMRASSLPMM